MKLTVNNSTSQVTHCTVKELKDLRSLLSYKVENSYFAGQFGGTRSLMNKRGEFPTGLLYLVKAYLTKQDAVQDLRHRPSTPPKPRFKLTLPFAPYTHQEAAVGALMACQGRGLIVAPTGSGKATICALIINRLQVRTLVVVPSLELKKQLTGSLKDAFGSQVGPLGSDIAVENVDALDPKIKLTGYDCVIIDEYHSSASKTYQDLNKKSWTNVYYRAGLTATPYRNKDEEKLLLESMLSQVVYEIDYQTAVTEGYIVPMQAFYYESPIKKTAAETWQGVNSELIVNNTARNEMIVDIICKLDDAGESTLVLLKEIKHGETLQAMLKARGKDIAFANGNNPDNRLLLLEFNLKERTTLIATGVLGTGVDTKPCKFVILAAGGKSRPQLIQNIGRCLRVSPGKEAGTVIMFRDQSHKWMRKHWNECVKHLRTEYGVTPIKLS